MKLVIFAVNVHQGGGAVLLNAMLRAVARSDLLCTAFLDSRLNVPEESCAEISVHWVKPRIKNRLRAELVLKSGVEEHDTVLFFGNLPPLFECRGKTLLFLQNRLLIDPISLRHFGIKTRLRISLERIWLKSFCRNIDTIVVQTQSMQGCVRKKLCRDSVIMPFLDTVNAIERSTSELMPSRQTTYDFLYVASGEPHKNHVHLVEAWALLAAEGIFPALCLTLSRKNYSELAQWIDKMVQEYDLKIVNSGVVNKAAVEELYGKTRALIYPSTLESFGLPLLEARNAGLAVVASELDYVRDVLDPDETFDPASPISISRAVKRFLGLDGMGPPLVDAWSFLNFCLTKST